MSDDTELPPGLEYVRTTDVFNERDHPAGLRRAHRVADGVWGLLKVHSGALAFVFEDQPDAPRTVAAGDTVAIPPARRHHVEMDEPVTFALDFYREVSTANPEAGTESTGLRTDG